MNTKKYSQLIKEHYIKLIELNEVEEYVYEQPETFDTPEGSQNNNYENLGSSIKKVEGSLSPESKSKAEAEISKILETGRSKMTHESYVGSDKSKRDEFEYITSVLGALHKDAEPSQQDNIRTFMFSSFNPYRDKRGSSSKLTRMVARNAGITNDLTSSDKSIDEDYYIGIVAESLYKAVDYALRKYNPDSTSFGRYMLLKASSNTIDEIGNKKYKTAFTGFGKTSGDAPMGGDEGDGGETMLTQMTAPEVGFTQEQKDGMKKIYEVIGVFIREKLENPNYKNWLEFYILFGEQGHSLEEISDLVGASVAALRVRKSRLEKFLTKFVQDGSMENFIRNKAGIKIKFPNNKFSLSAKEDEGESAEPLYIFKDNPDHPEGGEWIEIKKPKKYKRYTKDSLGDIAFGKNDDEEELYEIIDMIKESINRQSLSEDEQEDATEGELDIEQVIGNSIDNVIAGKLTKQEAINNILEMASKVFTYTSGYMMTPSMNEEAEDIDEERITNPEGLDFVKSKDNFIGSHVWGEKLDDGSYVVASYGKQFPIYIFWNKKNRWYENSDDYVFKGDAQESTVEHKNELRPTSKTIKKAASWMKKLSGHLLKKNAMTDYTHLSVEPGTKN